MEERYPGEESDRRVHRPEFVILREEYKETISGGQYRQETRREYETFEKLKDIKPSPSVRFACMLSSLILLSLSLVMALPLLGSLLLVILTFGQSITMKEYLNKYWLLVRKLLVTSLGLFIAVGSPMFGLGLIIFYFVLVVGGTNDPLFSRIFESRIYGGKTK